LRVDHRTLVDKVWDGKAMAVIRTGDSGEEAAKALAGIEGVVLRERSLRFAVLDEDRLLIVSSTAQVGVAQVGAAQVGIG
jgi:hypothetical protein